MGTPTRNDDAIASYSSKGPTLLDHIVKPDIVAPGNRIGSLIVKNSTLDVDFPTLEIAPTGTCTGTCATKYFRLSGTSMATPVISGAVALMLQQQPTLTPDTVKARIMKTAWKGFGVYCDSYDVYNNLYTNQYDLFTYGAGYLDINAALGDTDVANGDGSFANGKLQRREQHRNHRQYQFRDLGHIRGLGQLHRLGYFGSLGQLGIERELGGLGKLRSLGQYRGHRL